MYLTKLILYRTIKTLEILKDHLTTLLWHVDLCVFLRGEKVTYVLWRMIFKFCLWSLIFGILPHLKNS